MVIWTRDFDGRLVMSFEPLRKIVFGGE